MFTRPQQLLIAGAAIAALALGGSAIAGAAERSGSSSTLAARRTTGTLHPARDSRIHNPSLTDHELYVRHHQRLASSPAFPGLATRRP
jgi:hypothetical protein